MGSFLDYLDGPSVTRGSLKVEEREKRTLGEMLIMEKWV